VLVLQLGDLPAGWAPLPGESLRVPLAWVLRDPWPAGFRPLLRRERLGGYERSFWSPARRRVECEAAVYRSPRGARQVFALRARAFAAFLAARAMGRGISVRPLGDATVAYRLNGAWRGFIVSWRDRRVLGRCSGAGLGEGSLRETTMAARLQERRISRSLGWEVSGRS